MRLQGGAWNAGAIGKAWLAAWGVSNLTKPVRLVLVVALSPYVDRKMREWKARTD